MKIVIANSNLIHSEIEKLSKELLGAAIVNSKEDLTYKKLSELKPDYIFFLHWSYIISNDVFENFNCILFHMTDLPFGRGGSPLQNLILLGKEETLISAIKVEKGVDSGPVFLKKKLSLAGTSEEIFLRAGRIMFSMIKEILTNPQEPVAQVGEATIFKRRKPEESNVEAIEDLHVLYDYIRMLDAEGYPNAFVETRFFKLEFSRGKMTKDGIFADVKIIKK